jgi:hypothetical protein
MEIEYLYNFLDREKEIPGLVRKLSEEYEGWIWGENASLLAYTSKRLKDYWNVIIPSDKLWNSLKADKGISLRKIKFYDSERFFVDNTNYVVDVRRTDLSWFLNQEEFRDDDRFSVNVNYNALVHVHDFQNERNLPEKVKKLSEEYEGWIWGFGGFYLAKPDFSMPKYLWEVIIPSDDLLEKVSSSMNYNLLRKSNKHFLFKEKEGSLEYKVEVRRTDPLWFFTKDEFKGRPQVLVNLNYDSVMNFLSLGHIPKTSYSRKS